ncbi:MAG TPA: hypothetical protein PLJ21_13430, partial [Pseudobdellovibrionaceae bacterium]|nr:hypothetical protein [Pseudobdellovibrionaceae bacterium]
ENYQAHRFYYRTPLRDPFRNTFIGFHAVQEVIDSTAKNFRPQLIDRLFFKDNLDSVILFKQRMSRLNGLMYKEQVRSKDGNKLYQTLERRYAIYDLTKGRIFPNIEEETKTKHNPEGPEQSYIRTFRPLAYWEQTEEKVPLFPLTQAERVEGTGLQSVHTDKMLDYVHEKMQYNQVNTKYVMETYKETLRGKDNLKSKEDLLREFDENGNIKSECQDSRCQYYEYDNLGRVLSERSSKGDITTNTYQSSFPLPIIVERQNLKQINEYDFLTGYLLNSTNGYGVQYSNSYTDEGLLVRQTESNQGGNKITFDLKTPLTLCSLQGSAECRQPQVIEYQEQDQNKALYLDGLGRSENQSKMIDGRMYFSGLSLFGINDLVYTKNLSGFQQNTNKEFEITEIDELGRLVEKKLAHGDVIQNKYNHQCESQYLNNVLKLKQCYNSAGILSNVFTDGEGFQIESNELGQVQSISGIQSTFQWSAFGELISTVGTKKQLWTSEYRKFDDQGKNLSYTMPAIEIKRNEHLQVLST